MKKEKNKKKVLVAFSGGVDSVIAAIILQEKGFLVEGVFFDFFGKRKENTTKKAKELAKKIGVVLHIVDLKKEFKKEVIDSFLFELKNGRTPNPCVLCNKKIKFQTLLQLKKRYKADCVATGHYAKISKNKESILTAEDSKKDQTYFLWDVKKEWLKDILFPIGDFASKKEVRDLAKKHNLSIKKDDDSQEICFVGKNIELFLSKNISPKKGDIKTKEGVVVGKHNGTFYYTIGQRKGLNLPGGPYYVYKKDNKKNVVFVSKDEKYLFQKELFYKKANFFEKTFFPFDAEVKIRYRSKKVKAVVEKNKVIFSSPQRAVTSGQSVVFYKKKKLLGGAVIK